MKHINMAGSSLPKDSISPISGPEGGVEYEGGNDYGILLAKPVIKTKKPSMYKVYLLNDDYTPMDFVVLVLEKYFNMTYAEATEIMLNVHKSGVGLCGTFTYDVAETKMTLVMDSALKHQHPLQCTLEKE